MPDDILGGLVGAAGNILGGYFSNQYNKKAAQTAFQQQFDAQNFFNTHAIQQKVQDAKAAGISPEFALGAGTVSAPSMSVFSDSVGPGLAAAGQNIGRALTANMNADQRKLADLTVESAGLDVERKKEELKRLRSAGTGPAVSGQDDSERPKEAPGPEFKGMQAGGGTFRAEPGWSDANDVNNAYDDAVSEGYGVVRWTNDLIGQMARAMGGHVTEAQFDHAQHEIRKAVAAKDFAYVSRMGLWIEGKGSYPGRFGRR